MSILISNKNSNTIYIQRKEDVQIPGATKDPRPFADTLYIYCLLYTSDAADE